MKKTFALAAGLLLTVAAQAQGYISVAGGVSKYNEDCSGTTACDTTGSASRLLVGWRSGGGLAFEGLAINFGKAKATSAGIGVEIKAQAVGAGVAFHADLNPSFGLVARLGVANVKVKGSAPAFGYSTSETATKPYAGLGLRWHLGSMAYLEANWDAAQGKLEGENGNISAATLGVGVRF